MQKNSKLNKTELTPADTTSDSDSDNDEDELEIL